MSFYGYDAWKTRAPEDEYPDFDAPEEECGNCGGEGYVYDCIDGCCVDAESGCELCAVRCDYCNPRPVAELPEVRNPK